MMVRVVACVFGSLLFVASSLRVCRLFFFCFFGAVVVAVTRRSCSPLCQQPTISSDRIFGGVAFIVRFVCVFVCLLDCE
jgi:hypothetical protein